MAKFNLDLPLDNIFCFPIYFYFIFVFVSWLFLYLSIKILNILQLPSDKQIQEYNTKIKKEITKVLDEYTGLPIAISKQIVYEFLYDEDQSNIMGRILATNINAQHRCTQLFIAIYGIISMIFHLICWALIAWIHYEWSLNQTSTPFSTNINYQAWLISVYTFHPMFKLINYAFSIYILFGDNEEQTDPFRHYGSQLLWQNDRDNDLFDGRDSKVLYSLLVGLAYMLTFMSVIFPSIFTHIIPGLVYYFPISASFSCIAFMISLQILMRSDAALQTYEYFYKNIKYYILLMCPLYIIVMMLISSMACVYSNQLNENGSWEEYYMCIYNGIVRTEGYCHTFTIQWTDWRAIVLFVSWILF